MHLVYKLLNNYINCARNPDVSGVLSRAHAADVMEQSMHGMPTADDDKVTRQLVGVSNDAIFRMA